MHCDSWFEQRGCLSNDQMFPRILGQTKDVFQMKIDFLKNDLGYHTSTSVNFPSYLKYSIERVRLRLAMYNWLKDQGKADLGRSLSTVPIYPDNVFVRYYVNRLFEGPEVWQDLKKKIYSK